MIKKIFLTLVLISCKLTIWSENNAKWGFFGHKNINRLAITTLPPPLNQFFKKHMNYLVENAINPDKRRYIIENEGQKHFFDIDSYPDSILSMMPTQWSLVKDSFSDKFFKENGTLPWNLSFLKYQLTEAFKLKQTDRILRLAADAGHYIGDANVPLHTTSNYNGQLTDQHGIHGLWETRLPELYFSDYNLVTGKSTYINDFESELWKHILFANNAVDSVLQLERKITTNLQNDEKYGYEKRGKTLVKTYSRHFSERYHQELNGMVERQMKRSIRLVGNFWYTCWIDAGQPDLIETIDLKREKFKKLKLYEGRDH